MEDAGAWDLKGVRTVTVDLVVTWLAVFMSWKTVDQNRRNVVTATVLGRPGRFLLKPMSVCACDK
jgi:hypothetical protein